LRAIELGKQLTFVQVFADGTVKAHLRAQVVCHTEEVAIAYVEGTYIILERAPLGLIGIIYPHNALQGRRLLIYQLPLFIHRGIAVVVVEVE
jgi:hypothetical protein